MVNFKTTRAMLCAGLLAGTSFALSVTASAQDADALSAEYAATLQQIEDIKVATAQREVMMTRQQETIATLQSQIETVPATKEAVRGIVTEMAAEIEKVIESDLPFRKVERFSRLDRLRELIAAPDTIDADLFRRAMTLYDIEVNYGNTISAYTGDNPVNPGRRLAACRESLTSSGCNLSDDLSKQIEAGLTLDDVASNIQDGNYVHFGRMSFVYLDLDSREGYRWSRETNGWEPLSGGDIINVRRAVRIARGESAPGVVTAPIRVQAAQ